MHRRICLLVLLCLLVAAPIASAHQTKTEQLDQYLQACTDLKRFSGSVLVAKDGRIILKKGYGLANYELNVPCTPQTKYRIGSLTKQFTALAIMQLVDRGLLSVTDPVQKYLPDYPNGDKITLFHLLTHTSGIPDYTSDPSFLIRAMAPVSVDELIASFRDRPLAFPPGAEFDYSNSGYVLLGKIIEIVTGEYYDIYLAKHILTPLGLTETGYDLGVPLLPNRASGYLRGSDSLLNALHMDMSHLYAAGAMYSTVEDLYRWDRALYGPTIISPDSLEQILSPQVAGYGYGWYIFDVFDRYCTMHGGVAGGFSSLLMRFPADDAVIIILSNLGNAPVERIARDLAAIIFDQPYVMPQRK
ncbi:MAG: beta-lactamase family protein [Firmicutes bacterium]|nr:beta-lactamase family protein [Bacillota bacterium]